MANGRHLQAQLWRNGEVGTGGSLESEGHQETFFQKLCFKKWMVPKEYTQVVLYVHVNPHIHDHVHTHEEKQVPALVKWRRWIAGPH